MTLIIHCIVLPALMCVLIVLELLAPFCCRAAAKIEIRVLKQIQSFVADGQE